MWGLRPLQQGIHGVFGADGPWSSLQGHRKFPFKTQTWSNLICWSGNGPLDLLGPDV